MKRKMKKKMKKQKKRKRKKTDELPKIVVNEVDLPEAKSVNDNETRDRLSLDIPSSMDSRPSMDIPNSVSNVSLRSTGQEESKFNFSVLREQLKAMGRIKFEEIVIATLFLFLVLLWITRAPILSFPGWGFLFGESYVTDGTTAIFVCFFLFLIPAKNVPPNIIVPEGSKKKRYYIMDWDAMKSFPWDIILLFGGGFALADGYVTSGLTSLIGEALQSFQSIPQFVLVFLVTAIITVLNQITSNTATAQIFLPIIASMSRAVKIHPIMLMLPTTLACSFSFAFPISTPPNMIIFVTKKVSILDMFIVGTIMNVLGVILTTLFVYFLAPLILGFDANTFVWD